MADKAYTIPWNKIVCSHTGWQKKHRALSVFTSLCIQCNHEERCELLCTGGLTKDLAPAELQTVSLSMMKKSVTNMRK